MSEDECMRIPEYKSIKPIKKQYNTGEEPVLVNASDLNEYVCKYARSSSAPYKLICEVIGAIIASEWGLRIPNFAFIKICPEHWTPFRTINLSVPAFGSVVQKSVIDIAASWNDSIIISPTIQWQILNIALFDIWLANEDRNWNNANLMYNTRDNEFIVIDHGCILNTATFDFKLSLLTENESILYSDLAHTILREMPTDLSIANLSDLKSKFQQIRKNKDKIINSILHSVPLEWNINLETIKSKLEQLFELEWINDCWKTFVEYFNEAQNG